MEYKISDVGVIDKAMVLLSAVEGEPLALAGLGVIFNRVLQSMRAALTRVA